jgi:hypothetical protein
MEDEFVGFHIKFVSILPPILAGQQCTQPRATQAQLAPPDGNPNPKKLLCSDPGRFLSSGLKMRFFCTPLTNEVGVVANGTKVARR